MARVRGVSALADTVRANAAAYGFDLTHVDDVEIGARLATMPEDAADDVTLACLYLVYGARGRGTYRPPGPVEVAA